MTHCAECGGTPRWMVDVSFNGERPANGYRYACDWHLLRAVETLARETGTVLVTELNR
jgi:hypothetical protein